MERYSFLLGLFSKSVFSLFQPHNNNRAQRIRKILFSGEKRIRLCSIVIDFTRKHKGNPGLKTKYSFPFFVNLNRQKIADWQKSTPFISFSSEMMWRETFVSRSPPPFKNESSPIYFFFCKRVYFSTGEKQANKLKIESPASSYSGIPCMWQIDTN